MRIALISLFMTPLAIGCGDEKGSTEADECYSNDDCPDGQVCIISHDHEGDDHDHGGACEDADADAEADADANEYGDD